MAGTNTVDDDIIVEIKHLLKAEQTEFQRVVAVVAYEAINKSLTTTALKTKLHIASDCYWR